MYTLLYEVSCLLYEGSGLLCKREKVRTSLCGNVRNGGVPLPQFQNSCVSEKLVSNITCDNPVVGKHLDGNTRLLAEIYCSLQYVFGYMLVYFSL